MKFNEAKEILENEGYLITENYYGSVIEKHTVADEQEQDTYHGRLDGFGGVLRLVLLCQKVTEVVNPNNTKYMPVNWVNLKLENV